MSFFFGYEMMDVYHLFHPENEQTRVLHWKLQEEVRPASSSSAIVTQYLAGYFFFMAPLGYVLSDNLGTSEADP